MRAYPKHREKIYSGTEYIEEVSKKVTDIKLTWVGDLFQLLCKASSKNEG